MLRPLILLLLFSCPLLSQAYFQQEVNYTIRVRLDDVKHELHAYEEITYRNNAPVSLGEIWLHLWPNAYKDNQTAFAKQELISKTDFRFARDEERGHIDSLSFRVNNIPVELIYHPEHIDIARIVLPEPLQPGGTITITTPFRVKIPSSRFSRLGHTGQQYQLCQWYPKPAVYDPKGWHPMPYLNQGEFYSEFGSFEVQIETPENYIIAATGELQPNPEEERRIAENVSRTGELLKGNFPKNSPAAPSSSVFKTVVYRQDRVHDFAWFADKHYYIMQGEVQLPRSGKTVQTYAYFTGNEVETWSKAVGYTNDAVAYYSEWVGDYPYNVCKVVDGALSAGAGMEYPTITIIASPGNAAMLDQVIAHEVGHNWFYGILASNERIHPWMDEGINSYYEKRYMQKKYLFYSPLQELETGPFRRLIHIDDFRGQVNSLPYLFVARRNDDQPLNLASDEYTSLNYAAMIYEKTPLVLAYLAARMGQEKFDLMMQAYYGEWKFRHPYPEDFRRHVETYAGQPLPWLFDDLLGSRKRVDYSIRHISQAGVKVKNKGQVAGPVSISGIKQDSVYTAWYDGFKGSKRLPFPQGDFERYSINGTHVIPDFNPKNNEIRAKGLFKKAGKPVIRLGTGLEHPRFIPLYVFPAIGANGYNGFMAGAALYNIGLLRKNLEFIAVPLYGFKNRQLAGSAQVDYFIRPVSAFFKSLTLTGSAERYGLGIAPHFDRFTAGMTLHLKNRKSNSTARKELTLRHVAVQYTPYITAPPPVTEPAQLLRYGYNQLLFRFHDPRVYNPYGAIIDVQQGSTFAKASLTVDHFFCYNQKRKKGLDIRLFAGTFLWKSSGFNTGPDVRFRLSGQTGSQDYLFNEIYFARNATSGLWSQQMSETDGAFKIYSFRGQTSDYLFALNFKSALPGKIPVKLYADLGHYFNGEIDRDALNYNAGAILSVVPGTFEVYFPFLLSNRIRETLELNNISYGERIRFMLNIRLANPVKLLRTFNI